MPLLIDVGVDFAMSRGYRFAINVEREVDSTWGILVIDAELW
ncbi:MAG: hypothetical protein QOF44_86 [Streptomyces sp.]|jgi:hypothetical protein|nr:hypothetical protein [Streptomyces sp.]